MGGYDVIKDLPDLPDKNSNSQYFPTQTPFNKQISKILHF